MYIYIYIDIYIYIYIDRDIYIHMYVCVISLSCRCIRFLSVSFVPKKSNEETVRCREPKDTNIFLSVIVECSQQKRSTADGRKGGWSCVFWNFCSGHTTHNCWM